MSRRLSEEPSCCERRALLRGLGAAGLLLLGRCATESGERRPDRSVTAPDEGLAVPDQPPPPPDSRFVGADGGLPPIDLAAPTVTQTATFALG
jgi:hypothetical protein